METEPAEAVIAAQVDFGAIIAEMYSRHVLDCIVEIAHAISLDYPEKKDQYRDVPEEVSDLLENFKALIGKDPLWPDTMQRAAIYQAIFGTVKGDTEGAQFSFAKDKVHRSARAFMNRVYNTSVGGLRKDFLISAISFRQYLGTLRGSVIATGNKQTKNIFNAAAAILSAKGVASRFSGLPPAPSGAWPLVERSSDHSSKVLESTLSGDGAMLVEEVTKMLRMSGGPIGRARFITLQIVAQFGARSILGALHHGYGLTDEIDGLIGETYFWAENVADLEGETGMGPIHGATPPVPAGSGRRIV